jgi:hypothetical protein
MIALSNNRESREETRGYLKAGGCMSETPLPSSNMRWKNASATKNRCGAVRIEQPAPKKGQMPEGGVMPTPRRRDETVDSAPAFGRNGLPA